MTVEAAQPEPEDPELEWSEDSATVTIGADDNVFPTLTNPHSVTVSYSSSDGEKATIDASTGEITLVAAGETTISAAFAGDDTYEAQTVTYTLTVEAETYSLDVTDNVGALSQVIDLWYAGRDLNAVPAGDLMQVEFNEGYTADKSAAEGIIVTVTLNGDDISDNYGTFGALNYVQFDMPAVNSTIVLSEWQRPEPDPEPEEYDVILDAWGNDVMLSSHEPGDEVNEIYDTNFGNIVGVTPSNLQYILTDDDLTFTMPDEEVTFTTELPEVSTSFDFTGYEDNVTETPSSTGTVTYDGIYADDSTYIMGTATVTFAGTQQEAEQAVFILRSDAPSMKTGARIPVYVMNNDQLVLFGYGELTQQ